LSGGINVYGYGYGNPLAYADPNGLVALVLRPCVTSPQAAMDVHYWYGVPPMPALMLLMR
jgi:uncharacterized protein RhaS with RHS repeats